MSKVSFLLVGNDRQIQITQNNDIIKESEDKNICRNAVPTVRQMAALFVQDSNMWRLP